MYCNEIYQKTFDENVKKRFANTYKFANHDINKFILLLGRSVYLYEYMDDWEKFIETLLPEKMEEIIDADYTLIKRVNKDLKIKKIGKYHVLYFESNLLLLADVFENFQNMCLEIYELDPARFLNAPGLTW